MIRMKNGWIIYFRVKRRGHGLLGTFVFPNGGDCGDGLDVLYGFALLRGLHRWLRSNFLF